MSALNDTFQSIADAIRSKTGKEDPISPSDMADEIMSIPSGGSGQIINLTEPKIYDVDENAICARNLVSFSDEDDMTDIYFGNIISYTSSANTDVQLPENTIFVIDYSMHTFIFEGSYYDTLLQIIPDTGTAGEGYMPSLLSNCYYRISHDCRTLTIRHTASSDQGKACTITPIIKGVPQS